VPVVFHDSRLRPLHVIDIGWVSQIGIARLGQLTRMPRIVTVGRRALEATSGSIRRREAGSAEISRKLGIY
jgi:hypothetical protein